MKKLKYIPLLTILAALLLFPSCKANAADNGYYISEYNVLLRVRENATVEVTERIKAHFRQERHGIVRAIPMKQSVKQKNHSGRTMLYKYRTPVTALNVTGAPYETEKKNGALQIKIGDPDRTVTGDQEYEISYILDMGEDRIKDYDRFYYDIIGPDWDTYIEKVNFTINFSKDTDLSHVKIYDGRTGSKTSGKTISEIGENEITGTSKGLTAGESVTVHINLPEGYYQGVRKFNPGPSIFLLVILCFFLIRGVFLYRKFHTSDKLVTTVEFYPPEGITSADVGYILDHNISNKELFSLILWFAENGYLTITEKEDHLLLKKLKNADPHMPEYMLTMFITLFPGNKDEFRTDLPDEGMYEGLEAAGSSLKQYYKGEGHQLIDEKISGKHLLNLLATAIFTGSALFFCGGTLDIRMIVMSVYAGLVLAIGGFALNRTWNNLFRGRNDLRTRYIVVTVLYGIACFPILWWNNYVHLLLLILILAAGFLSTLITAPIQEYTAYYVELSGKLLGFRRFIETAELDRLKMLAEETPSYFYHILPYAYVFGLTDVWIKRFEEIPVAVPAWITGDQYVNAAPYLYMHHFMRCFDSSCTKTVDLVNEQYASTISGGTDSGSFGGGGFSGGGFGGGGGSSW